MDQEMKPHWDADRRELTVAGKVIKRIRRPSSNQERILAIFEEDGWPPKLDDPLPGNPDAKHRLRDTVYHLNHDHVTKDIISFHTDGTGEAVLWELRHTYGTQVSVQEV